MIDFRYYIFMALAVLITLSVHEFSHALVAYKLGDNTAKISGRLTINPIKHIDPIGALCMLLFGFGWAKPVPINARNFKNPKKGFALSALAGPLSNLILGFIFAFLYLLTLALAQNANITSEFLISLISNTLLFIYIFHSVNIGLAIFNLIPIPPLDGSRILNVILPPKAYFAIMRYERKIYFAMLAWLLFGTYAYRGVMMIDFVAANPVLSVLAKTLSLSELITSLVELVSNGMFDLFRLIPFLNV